MENATATWTPPTKPTVRLVILVNQLFKDLIQTFNNSNVI
jgi:hypothetical protein